MLITLVAACPGFIALAVGQWSLRQERYAEIRQEAEYNATAAVSELQQIIAGIGGVLHTVSQSADIDDLGSPRCHEFLSAVRSRTSSIETMGITDSAGVIRCHSDELATPASVADRDYYKEALSTRELAIGTFVQGRVSRQRRLPLAFPVIRSGVIRGVVIAGLDLNWLNEHIARRGLARGAALTVADRNGVIVARQPLSERFVGTSIPSSFAHLVTAEKSGTIEVVSQDGTPRQLSYVPISQTGIGLYLSAGASSDEAVRGVNDALRRAVIFLLCSLLAVVILTWFVAQRIIRQPIVRIVEVAQSWRNGDLQKRTGLSAGTDELGLLGETFDRLIDENAVREAQRTESENRREILVRELSHRVKNVLATVQSIASLTFKRGQRGGEAYPEFEGRLQSLVRGHDILTEKQWQPAELQEIIEREIAPLRQPDRDQFVITGPLVLVRPSDVVPVSMIIHELSTNAVKYGALSSDKGTVRIEWQIVDSMEATTTVDFTWQEQGGPQIVSEPKASGFGSQLLARLAQQLSGSIKSDYVTSGLITRAQLKFSTRDESRERS